MFVKVAFYLDVVFSLSVRYACSNRVVADDLMTRLDLCSGRSREMNVGRALTLAFRSVSI